jgi:hypothetical protein
MFPSDTRHNLVSAQASIEEHLDKSILNPSSSNVVFMARLSLAQDVASKQRRAVAVGEPPRRLRASKQGRIFSASWRQAVDRRPDASSFTDPYQD